MIPLHVVFTSTKMVRLNGCSELQRCGRTAAHRAWPGGFPDSTGDEVELWRDRRGDMTRHAILDDGDIDTGSLMVWHQTL